MNETKETKIGWGFCLAALLLIATLGLVVASYPDAESKPPKQTMTSWGTPDGIWVVDDHYELRDSKGVIISVHATLDQARQCRNALRIAQAYLDTLRRANASTNGEKIE